MDATSTAPGGIAWLQAPSVDREGRLREVRVGLSPQASDCAGAFKASLADIGQEVPTRILSHNSSDFACGVFA